MKKEFLIPDNNEITILNETIEKNDNDIDEIDPDYEYYLQNEFQDSVISDIFSEIVEYISNQAIPICEHLTLEDVEIIIENI